MRTSIALEAKSHRDSGTPITGFADSRVSVWLSSQSCADAESDQRMITIWFGPGFEGVLLEIAKIDTPKGDMEEKRLLTSDLIRLRIFDLTPS